MERTFFFGVRSVCFLILAGVLVIFYGFIVVLAFVGTDLFGPIVA